MQHYDEQKKPDRKEQSCMISFVGHSRTGKTIKQRDTGWATAWSQERWTTKGTSGDNQGGTYVSNTYQNCWNCSL